MKLIAVIGAGYGDEGKGSTVNYLAKKAAKPIVVRYNGGPQAGHTVVQDGVRHVFSHFGSATLSGVPTFWSEYAYVEPGALINEWKVLSSIMGDDMPEMIIEDHAPVITPYDIMANRKDADNLSHGTCGMGFGMAAKRNEESPYRLYYKDLLDPWVLRIRLQAIGKYYGYKGDEDDNLASMISDFMWYCSQISGTRIKSHSELVPSTFWDAEVETIIFEGAQGLLLDREGGFFPHVTRSHTGVHNILNFIDDMALGGNEMNLYYVTRCYLTRHGNGPLSKIGGKVSLINNENETNVTNQFQGELRTAPLDIDLLANTISSHNSLLIDANYHLVVTCMDQFEGDIPIVAGGKLMYVKYEDFVFIMKSDVFPPNTIFSHSEEFFNVDDMTEKLTKHSRPKDGEPFTATRLHGSGIRPGLYTQSPPMNPGGMLPRQLNVKKSSKP